MCTLTKDLLCAQARDQMQEASRAAGEAQVSLSLASASRFVLCFLVR